MHAPWKESYGKPSQCIEKQRHHFANKGPYSQSYDFSSSHVQIWELDPKEDWALKNWCFQIAMLEKTLESPSDSKEIKPVNPKGNKPWIFFGRTDAEAEAPMLWPPDAKSQLIGKDPDAGKDWEQEEKRGDRGWDGWMASLTQCTGVWANCGTEWRKGSQEFCSLWGHSQTQLSNWIIMNSIILCPERITLSDFFSREKKDKIFSAF